MYKCLYSFTVYVHGLLFVNREEILYKYEEFSYHGTAVSTCTYILYQVHVHVQGIMAGWDKVHCDNHKLNVISYGHSFSLLLYC